MNASVSNFLEKLEKHIEVIVLVIAAAVTLWLLFARFFISPNSVSYNNKSVDVGSVDAIIYERAKQLDSRLAEKPEPVEPYVSSFDGKITAPDSVAKWFGGSLEGGFEGLYQSVLADMSNDSYGWKPPLSTLEVTDGREYALPEIDPVENPELVYIRTPVYMPNEEVEPMGFGSGFEQSNEPNDIDLVTVSAVVDTAALYDSFHEKFMGLDVPVQWRDPCLAVPVFAAVELQRQRLLPEGTWSEWDRVPRLELDPYRDLFEIHENLENLPLGGMKLRLVQYSDPLVQKQLVQPISYPFASQEEEWFPARFYEKFKELQARIELQERRQEIKEKKEERKRKQQELTGGAGGTAGRRPAGRNRRQPRTAQRRRPVNNRRQRDQRQRVQEREEEKEITSV